ncbi:ferredoxin [Scopulibacillus darangshiensis]|uniref:Ferredoxin n=1 Tax=Scopulibacillus darangshiensis TaxID=442528 RepID=A0A4R2P3V9_9BACL|nr:ferredoxin [Scopulibacillus darangshiensis]TCP28818.1 ferredoxin [Scopulibacillus darangshiensis]
MAKFVVVNQETCIGCGNCEGIAPDIFDFDESGLAFVKLDGNQGIKPIPEDKIDEVSEAMDECPTDSVKIADQPFEQKD